MSVIIEAFDKTIEAQRGITRLADLLDRAASAEDRFSESADSAAASLQGEAAVAKTLNDQLNTLNTTIKKLASNIEKKEAAMQKGIAASKEYDASIGGAAGSIGTLQAKLEAIKATLGEVTGGLRNAATSAKSASGAFTGAADGSENLGRSAARQRRLLTDEERALRAVEKAHRSGSSTLQRLLDNKKELDALEGKAISQTDRYREARERLNAAIARGIKKEEIAGGRTFSEQLDAISAKMSGIPGPVGRAGSVLSGFNKTLGGIGVAGGEAASGVGSILTASTGAALGAGAIAAGGAAIVGGLVAAGFHSKEFTKQLKTLENVSGATGAELDALHDAAINAGIATQFTPTQALEGLQELASLGFKAREQTELLLPVLDLAAAGNLSVGTAAKVAGSTLKAYGIDAKDARAALDKLVAVSNQSAIQFNDLAQAIAKSSVGANAANQSLDEMLITMGLARNVGVEIEVAATGVNSSLIHMSGEGRKAFNKMKIELEDSKGNFRKFGDILVDLAAKTKNMGDVERARTLEQALSREGMRAAVPIIKQLQEGVQDASGQFLKGADAMAHLRAELEKSGGTLEKFKANQLDTLDGSITLFKGSLDTLATVIGETVEPALKGIFQFATAGINYLIEAAQGAKTVLKDFFGEQDENTRSKQLGSIQEEIDSLEPKLDRMQSILIALRAGDSVAGFKPEELSKANAEYDGMNRRLQQLNAIRKELTTHARNEAVAQYNIEESQKKQKSAAADAEKNSKKREGDYKSILQWIQKIEDAAEKAITSNAKGTDAVYDEETRQLRDLEREKEEQSKKAHGRADLLLKIDEAYASRRESILIETGYKVDEIHKKEREEAEKTAKAEIDARRAALKDLRTLSKSRIAEINADAENEIEKYKELGEKKRLTEEEVSRAIYLISKNTTDEINELKREAVKKAESYNLSGIARLRSQADEEIEIQKKNLDQKLINEQQYQAAKAAIEKRYQADSFRAALDEISGYADYAKQFAEIISENYQNQLDARIESGKATREELKEVDAKLADAEFEQQKISLEKKKIGLEKKLQADKDAAMKVWRLQQGAAITQAIIDGFLAEMKLTSMYPPVLPTLPMWAIGTALIAAQTGVAVAGISEQPAPSFHSGTAASSMGLAPDEVMAKHTKRETVFNPRATEQIINTVNDINGGGSQGSSHAKRYDRHYYRRDFFDSIIGDAAERRGPLRNYAATRRTRWGMK